LIFVLLWTLLSPVFCFQVTYETWKSLLELLLLDKYTVEHVRELFEVVAGPSLFRIDALRLLLHEHFGCY